MKISLKLSFVNLCLILGVFCTEFVRQKFRITFPSVKISEFPLLEYFSTVV